MAFDTGDQFIGLPLIRFRNNDNISQPDGVSLTIFQAVDDHQDNSNNRDPIDYFREDYGSQATKVMKWKFFSSNANIS